MFAFLYKNASKELRIVETEWPLFSQLDEIVNCVVQDKLRPLDAFWVTVYQYYVQGKVDYGKVAGRLREDVQRSARLDIWDLGLVFALRAYLHYNRTGEDANWNKALEYLRESNFFVYPPVLKPDIGFLVGFCHSKIHPDDVRKVLEQVKGSGRDRLSFRVYLYAGQIITRDRNETPDLSAGNLEGDCRELLSRQDAPLEDRLLAAAVLKAYGKAADAMGQLISELNREGAPLTAYSWTSPNGEAEHEPYFLHKAAHTLSKVLIALKLLELDRAVLVNDSELVRRLKDIPRERAVVTTRGRYLLELFSIGVVSVATTYLAFHTGVYLFLASGAFPIIISIYIEVIKDRLRKP